MSEDKKEELRPVAWAFYWPDGRVRFIVEGEERAKAWSKSHEGKVVPLYPGKEGQA